MERNPRRLTPRRGGIYGNIDVLPAPGEDEQSLSTGERFGRAFAAAAHKASTSIPEYLVQQHKAKEKEAEEKKTAIAKEKAKLLPGINTHLKSFDERKSFKSKHKMELQDRAEALIEQGLPYHEAIDLAYRSMLAEAEDQGEGGSEEQPSNGGSFSGEGDFSQNFRGNPELQKDVGIGLMKGGRLGAGLIDFPFEAADWANKAKRTAIGKLMGLTDEQIENKEKIIAENSRRGQVSLGIPEKYAGKGVTGAYDVLTEGKGKPTNAVERVAQGIPLGLPGVAGAFTGETLRAGGLPESVQQAGEILSFLFAHKIKVPQLKEVIGKAERTAKATGRSTEEVLQKAQQESGVDLQKVAAGDAESIKSLKDRITEVPKISERVKETPKEVYNKKAAQKEREVFGAKLADSPLREHYDSELRTRQKEDSKRPETRARDQEIRDRLAPEETRLFEEIRNKKEQLTRIDKARKNSVRAEDKERVDSLYKAEERAYNERLERLKDVQYEMKHGTPRPTEAEIDAQIGKSIEKYKEGILNPTEKTLKDVTHQLELDQQYLNLAERILKRGELPGEIRPDTFLKMKSKYLEGYKTAIQQAREEIKSLKGSKSKADLKKIADDRVLVERLDGRVKRLEADLVNQTDKIKSLRALEKPSGAFYKQQIKSLKKDAALFEHDLFKQHKFKSPSEFKTSRVFTEKSAEIGEKVIKDPSPENLEKASAETGKSKERVKEEIKKVKEENKGIIEEVKKGTVTPNKEAKWGKGMKRLAVSMGAGFALGAVLELTNELGFKPDTVMTKRIATFFSGVTIGPTSYGRDVVRDLFDTAQAHELKKLEGNFSAHTKYLDAMERKSGKAKVRRVMKAADELED